MLKFERLLPLLTEVTLEIIPRRIGAGLLFWSRPMCCLSRFCWAWFAPISSIEVIVRTSVYGPLVCGMFIWCRMVRHAVIRSNFFSSTHRVIEVILLHHESKCVCSFFYAPMRISIDSWKTRAQSRRNTITSSGLTLCTPIAAPTKKQQVITTTVQILSCKIFQRHIFPLHKTADWAGR